MLKFITNIEKGEPDILSSEAEKPLMILSLEGQLLARYEPPVNGWTHDRLTQLASEFPHQWDYCGADALLGESFVGSTEI
ncbi:hypothetical protein [Photobacterium leiognathi]|uniref:hypothetical protein n=1 Tax=Photobacterium leiognathi TaxID=553611 RepID=UPI00273554E0|nr:hypothetical protein [Photobacterium leiognathi]